MGFRFERLPWARARGIRSLGLMASWDRAEARVKGLGKFRVYMMRHHSRLTETGTIRTLSTHHGNCYSDGERAKAYRNCAKCLSQERP